MTIHHILFIKLYTERICALCTQKGIFKEKFNEQYIVAQALELDQQSTTTTFTIVLFLYPQTVSFRHFLTIILFHFIVLVCSFPNIT